MYTIESIKEGVEDFFEIDLGSKKRDNRHFRARSLFYKLCFNLTFKPTYQAIGKAVNRNHATVIYSVKTFDMNMKFDRELNEMYQSLKSVFKDFQINEVTLSDLLRNNLELRTKIDNLEIDLENEKRKPPVVSEYHEISLINDLMNKLDEDQRYLLSCKLEALYNLNKTKIK
jgi:hypothetical protein